MSETKAKTKTVKRIVINVDECNGCRACAPSLFAGAGGGAHRVAGRGRPSASDQGVAEQVDEGARPSGPSAPPRRHGSGRDGQHGSAVGFVDHLGGG